MAWNVIHVDIGSKRSEEEALNVYKAFSDKKNQKVELRTLGINELSRPVQ